MNHGKVKRTEILIKRKVCQVIINIEKERVFIVLWWFGIRYPVQFVYKLKY